MAEHRRISSTFHNVGQGLFYSCHIDDFNMIYDCGSTERKHVRGATDKYKNSHSSKIDLLVISHLHDDHTSGLEFLLKDTEVDTLVLPYLQPIDERHYEVPYGDN